MSDIGMGYGEMQIADLCKGYGIGPLHKEVIKDCSFTLEKSKLDVYKRQGGVRITVIWHRCGRRKAACNAIRETKSGTCSAASAYPFPPFPSLPRLSNATVWLD